MLSEGDARAALDELVKVLEREHRRSRIYIVGGAALMLHFGARVATKDIDAQITPLDEVQPLILEVARRRGLADDWLNGAAAMYVPPHVDDPNPTILIETEHVIASVASAQMLLAMKIRASRGRQDLGDIIFLVGEVGVSSVAAAVELYERFYPEDPLRDRALRILEAVFSEGADRTLHQ
jgi:hypothetical protein